MACPRIIVKIGNFSVSPKQLRKISRIEYTPLAFCCLRQLFYRQAYFIQAYARFGVHLIIVHGHSHSDTHFLTRFMVWIEVRRLSMCAAFIKSLTSTEWRLC